MPIRRTRSEPCARAASGHVAAPPPIRVMKSRRRIGTPPGADDRHPSIPAGTNRGRCAAQQTRGPDVRFGSLASFSETWPMSALPPKATAKADIARQIFAIAARVKALAFPYASILGVVVITFHLQPSYLSRLCRIWVYRFKLVQLRWPETTAT